jgi:hypothetical protein
MIASSTRRQLAVDIIVRTTTATISVHDTAVLRTLPGALLRIRDM